MKRVKYGIVSTAQVVPRFIAGVNATDFGEVVAISSRNVEKAKAYAKTYQIPRYYDNEASLFNDEEIDVIYVATYNAGHFSSARNALLAGKHVLIEKPFTLSLVEAKELYELAEKNNLFIMEAQKSLFLPLTQKIKTIIESEVIGNIVSIFSVTAYASVDHIKWFKDLNAGGGTVHFMAPYALSYLPYILNKKVLDYNGIAQLNDGNSDMQSMLHLSFEEDILVNIYLTTKKALPKSMRIIGTKGEIVIPEFWRGQEATISFNDGSCETITAPFSNDFEFEIEHVNQKIISKQTRSEIMTQELSLFGVEVMSKLYQNWTSQVK